MKRLLFITFLLLQTGLHAQKKPCEFSTDISDSIGTYKETKGKIMHERVFGNSSSYIFFALAKVDGMPILKFQLIQKSKDFIKVNCLNEKSKLYVQLANGKIITLLIADEGNCGSMVHDGNQTNIRITSASFLFLKDTMEELKKSPITMFRIKYANETFDYLTKETLVSELDKETYNPERFFMDYISCVMD